MRVSAHTPRIKHPTCCGWPLNHSPDHNGLYARKPAKNAAQRPTAGIAYNQESGEEGPVACAICEQRKEKRVCLALPGRICPVCCGEQREFRLECPADCPWLQQARRSERPRTAEDLAGEELFREVVLPAGFRYEHEPLVAGLLFAVARTAATHGDWHDGEVIAALTAVARDLERRRRSGIIYAEPSPNPALEVLRAELERMVADYRKVEEQNQGFVRLKDRDTFHALVMMVRMAQAVTNGRPKSRRFLHGLLAQFPDAATGAKSGPAIVLS